MLWYLASPYSLWHRGLEDAFEQACIAAAKLIRQGYFVFSPIAHSHPIAVHGDLDKLDHKLWLEQDERIMDAAAGLIVLRMPGWQHSKGVLSEIAYFERAKKPIRYFEWPDMAEYHA